MNKTKIEWCDYTWNPIVGCSPVSVGCRNCYAEKISRRFHLPWGSARLMPDRVVEPLLVKRPGRVFVCSMSDLGHESVKPRWREFIYDAMEAAPWHTYIILTKRPGPWLRTFYGLGWVGVTAENQATYESRWLELTAQLQGPGHPPRFLSVEPMLGPVKLNPDWCKPDWVIAGPETGPGARPCEDAWIDDLEKQSRVFFDKRKTGWSRREWPK